jgi:hypothetical protein
MSLIVVVCGYYFTGETTLLMWGKKLVLGYDG